MPPASGPITLPLAETAYTPGLFRGVRPRTLDLDEYEEAYQVFSAEADAPLLSAMGGLPLLRVRIPADLRAREALFAGFDTRVTRCYHSQPPHVDHPHRRGDPRRYNVFWAEAARRNASTYFLPLALGGPVADRLTAFLRANAEAWEASQPKLAMYREDPLIMSRYRVPEDAVLAYVGLVRDGEDRAWARLSPYGQTTTAARILGNTPVITGFLSGFFAWIQAAFPGALYVETWSEPCLLVADDTRCLHGRYGEGESGGGFFRIWLCGEGGPEGGEGFRFAR